MIFFITGYDDKYIFVVTGCCQSLLFYAWSFIQRVLIQSTIPKNHQKKPRCIRKQRDKSKYNKDKSFTMFSLAEGCGCVSFRGGRRARSQADDSSSCRSSEIEQEVPKRLGRRMLNGECTMKALAPLLRFWRKDEVSMTKAERSKYCLLCSVVNYIFRKYKLLLIGISSGLSSRICMCHSLIYMVKNW